MIRRTPLKLRPLKSPPPKIHRQSRDSTFVVLKPSQIDSIRQWGRKWEQIEERGATLESSRRRHSCHLGNLRRWVRETILTPEFRNARLSADLSDKTLPAQWSMEDQVSNPVRRFLEESELIFIIGKATGRRVRKGIFGIRVPAETIPNVLDTAVEISQRASSVLSALKTGELAKKTDPMKEITQIEDLLGQSTKRLHQWSEGIRAWIRFNITRYSIHWGIKENSLFNNGIPQLPESPELVRGQSELFLRVYKPSDLRYYWVVESDYLVGEDLRRSFQYKDTIDLNPEVI